MPDYQDIYNNYFGTKERQSENSGSSQLDNEPQEEFRGNIGDIDTFAELLRTILNAVWGSNWGEFGPELKRGEDPENITLPQITYDIYNREVTEKMPIKPILTGTLKEVVEGKETGDAFQIYRQWFDCIVEFNIWGKDTFETRTIANGLETILGSYAGYFKKKGIAEMFFLREVSSRLSDRYLEGMPMKAILYYFKIERIQTLRVSTIEKINFAIEAYDRESQNRVTNSYNIKTDNITYDL
jgi:hypothetical protein